MPLKVLRYPADGGTVDPCAAVRGRAGGHGFESDGVVQARAIATRNGQCSSMALVA
jgi:hypothetical protein